MKHKVLYFSATWCASCRVIRKSVESLEEENPDIQFQKLDVDTEATAAAKFGVRSVPTLIHLQDGVEVARVVGSRTKEDLSKELGL